MDRFHFGTMFFQKWHFSTLFFATANTLVPKFIFRLSFDSEVARDHYANNKNT